MSLLREPQQACVAQGPGATYVTTYICIGTVRAGQARCAGSGRRRTGTAKRRAKGIGWPWRGACPRTSTAPCTGATHPRTFLTTAFALKHPIEGRPTQIYMALYTSAPLHTDLELLLRVCRPAAPAHSVRVRASVCRQMQRVPWAADLCSRLQLRSLPAAQQRAGRGLKLVARRRRSQ